MANGTDTIDLSAGFVSAPPQKKDSGIDLSAGFVKTPAGGTPPSAGVSASEELPPVSGPTSLRAAGWSDRLESLRQEMLDKMGIGGAEETYVGRQADLARTREEHPYASEFADIAGGTLRALHPGEVFGRVPAGVLSTTAGATRLFGGSGEDYDTRPWIQRKAGDVADTLGGVLETAQEPLAFLSPAIPKAALFMPAYGAAAAGAQKAGQYLGVPEEYTRAATNVTFAGLGAQELLRGSTARRAEQPGLEVVPSETAPAGDAARTQETTLPPEALAVDRNVHPNVHLEDASEKAEKSAAGEPQRATIAIEKETGLPVITEGHDGSAGAEVGGAPVRAKILPEPMEEAEISGAVALNHWGKEGKGYPAKMGNEAPPFTGGEQQGEEKYTPVPVPPEAFHPASVGEEQLPRQAEPEAQTPAITERAPREGQLLPPLQGEQAAQARAPYSHEALAPGQTTQEAHRNADGVWNADRAASTHQRYDDSLRVNERRPPQGRPPEAVILIGGTASGKTSLADKLLGEDPNRLHLDADKTKMFVDEYEGLKQSDPENAAARVHDESKYMTKKALAEAQARGLDFVYDSTTGGSDAAELIRRLKRDGYHVRVMATDLPVEEAIRRSVERSKTSSRPENRGRNVPLKDINRTHQEAPETFFRIKDMPEIGEISLHDNSGPEFEPAYRRVDAQPEEVYNNGEALERFRAKGQAKPTGGETAPAGRVAGPAPAGLPGAGGLGGVRPSASGGQGAAGIGEAAAPSAAGQLPTGRELAAGRGVPVPGEVSPPPAAPAPSGVTAAGLSPEKGPGQGPEAELFAGAPAPKTLGFAPAQAFAKWYDKKIGTPMWEGAQKLANAALHFDALKRTFLQEGGRPEGFQALKKETKAKADFGAFEGMALGKRLAVGSQADQEILGKILRGELSPDQVRAVRGDPRLQDALDAVRHARNLLDNDLGMRAVLQDLLSDKTFFQNYGRYMPRLYRQFEVDYDGAQQKFGTLKPTRLQMDRFMKRGDIPDEVRMLMGEIKEPAYPVAKGIGQLSRNVAYAEMFDKISQNPEWTAKGEREGFTQMPETNRLGKLSGQWVRSDIASDLNESIRTPSEWSKMWGSVISAYKWNKVVANPASFVWHPTSRVMMNYLGGLPPTRVDIYSRAVLDTVKQTGMWERAAKSGAFDPGQIQAGELNDLLDSWNKTSGNMLQRIGRLSADLAEKAKSGQWGSAIGQAISPTRGYANEALLGMPAKITRLYAGLEQITKTAKFAHNLELGMDDFQAAQDARKWGVDYENVSKSVQFLRRTGIAPFITYPAQAIPLMMESAVRAPWRLATIGLGAYALQDAMRKKLGISAQDDAQIRAATRVQGEKGTGLESGFMGTGVPGMARFIPIMRDREGRIEYLDLAHILHWTGVGQPSQPGVKPMGPLDPSTYVMGSPIVSIGGPLLTGRDPYTGKDLTLDYPESGKLGVGAERLWKTFAPSAVFQGQAIYRSATGQPGGFGRQPTDLPEQAVGSLTGFNVRPFDPETEQAYRQREYREEKGALENKIRRVQNDPRLSDEDAERQLRVLDAQMEKLERRYDEVFGELPKEALPPARP